MRHREGEHPLVEIQEQEQRQEKERRWLEKLEEIKAIRDARGEPIDPRMREVVTGCNLADLPTSGSCEGHIDHGYAAPWVAVSSPEKPRERFVGESKAIALTAEKYGISEEGIRRNIFHDARREASKFMSGEETPEYRLWRSENERLRAHAKTLLEEFYQGRTVDPAVRLEIESQAEGFRIHNGGSDYSMKKMRTRTSTDDELDALAKRLSSYQNEMQEFADFLHGKYLDSADTAGL